jgi:hypothetical protein
MFWGFFFRKTLYTDLNMANITSDEEEENGDFPLYSVIIFGIIISITDDHNHQNGFQAESKVYHHVNFTEMITKGPRKGL